MANDSMVFNDDWFDDLVKSPPVVALVHGAAEDIAGIARSTAGVDTGEYRDGIVVRDTFRRGAVSEVVATDPKSLIIESKTGNLVKALQQKKRQSRG